MLKPLEKEDLTKFNFTDEDAIFIDCYVYYLRYPAYIYNYKGTALCMGGIAPVDEGVAGVWTCVSKEAQSMKIPAVIGLNRIWKNCVEQAVKSRCRRIQSVAEDTPKAIKINTAVGLCYEGRLYSYYGDKKDGLMFAKVLK